MAELPSLYYTSPRGQCAVLLLAALRDLFLIEGRGVVPKQQAIHYIYKKRWFDFEPDDLEPYESQRWTSKEPRWNTLIAWARKDAVLRDFISHQARDEWGLTRSGRDVIDRFHESCRTGRLPVVACFLWSENFKRFLYPEYKQSVADTKRPSSFYRDHLNDVFERLMGLI